MKIIHQLIDKIYRHFGRWIARYPFYFLIIPTFLTLLLSLGILNISYRRDFNKLFISTRGRSIKEREMTLKYFHFNLSTEFDLSRFIDAGLNVHLIINAIDGKCILRENIYEEIRLIDKTIQNITVIWNDEEVNYSQICAMNFGQCSENTGLFNSKTISDFQNNIFKMKYPVEIDLKTYKVTPYAVNFGGVTTDKQGYIKKVLAYRFIYVCRWESKRISEVSKEWKRNVIKRIQNMKFRYINVFIGSTNYEDYSKEFTDNIISFGSISILMILIFCMIACMTTDWIRSKPWLGLSAFFSALLATISSFGMMMLSGVQYIDLNSALPFLMIGMGIDDSFVLLSAWRRCISYKDVVNRMEKTYSEVALSITITSFTNIISFTTGIFTPFPAISIFCTYATVGIFFNFLYQLTFFGSCLALTGFREHRGLHPFTCRRKESDIEKLKLDDKERIMNFIGNKLGRQITKPRIKLIICISCISCLAMGICGIMQINEGFDLTQILSAESAMYKFMKSYNKYFTKYAHRIHVIVNRPVNYANKSIQHQIENTLKKFEDHHLISDSNFTESWLRAFLMFANSPVSKFSLGAFNISQKQDFIDGLRIFLKFPQTRNFRKDVTFNANYTEIIASRFFVSCNDVKTKEEIATLINDMWNIADSSEITITVFSFVFLYFEQVLAIRPIAIQTISIAVASIMIVFFCFISNIMSCLCIALSVIFIITEVIGFMALWGIHLDIFSLVNIIMCIGFCINYPAHMTYTYITCDETESKKRLQVSLYSMGLPILQGSLSTLVAISIFVIDASYMFTVFIKIIFLVVILTAFHSFFFVPIILDICHCYFGVYTKVSKRKSVSNDSEPKGSDD